MPPCIYLNVSVLFHCLLCAVHFLVCGFALCAPITAYHSTKNTSKENPVFSGCGSAGGIRTRDLSISVFTSSLYATVVIWLRQPQSC